MNIDEFQNLIDRSNDIYENRVNNLLDSMLNVELYSFPTKEPWTTDKFLEEVKQKCKNGSKELQKKSTMVEDAIEDLISLAFEFRTSITSQKLEISREADSHADDTKPSPMQRNCSLLKLRKMYFHLPEK